MIKKIEFAETTKKTNRAKDKKGVRQPISEEIGIEKQTESKVGLSHFDIIIN
jgi:hypothetical protein